MISIQGKQKDARQNKNIGICEVIALDMNAYWSNATALRICHWSACPLQCEEILAARTSMAFELFFARRARSTASNLIVFSHYPADYFVGRPDFLQALGNSTSKRHIAYFGGHRHNVDMTSVTPIGNSTNWLSGGGGGWGCDGDYSNENASASMGFVLGQIAANGTLTARAITVDPGMCCPGYPPR